ncbi:MAG: OsmC family protein [Caldisericaceae bacterium]|nr:OsmC family protein [Caldisericaceae bacterium]
MATQVKGKVVHIKGVTFNGITDSNHWVPMDGPPKFGGENGAIRPKELLLLSLAGCTGSDVASILIKMRQKFHRFEVHVDAEMADEHPKVYTKIHLTYKIWGEVNEQNLVKAINLSQDVYCAVTAMLQKAVEITHSYEINPEE